MNTKSLSVEGKYRLKERGYFMSGKSAFGLDAGAVITVTQVDEHHDKVLIDFGGGTISWKPVRILRLFEPVEPNAVTSFKAYHAMGSVHFLLQNKPRCPHCGAEYDPAEVDDWDAYEEEEEHFTDCSVCDEEFSFMTKATYEFTTMGPEDE